MSRREADLKRVAALIKKLAPTASNGRKLNSEQRAWYGAWKARSAEEFESFAAPADAYSATLASGFVSLHPLRPDVEAVLYPGEPVILESDTACQTAEKYQQFCHNY